MGELHNTYIGSACNYIAHALNTFGELMDRHTTSTRTLIVIATIIALSGAASATDYYVATWGDNTTQGNITHPWQNVSYAAQQATAGDTVYLFDGTWYNEIVTVINSGNATHPITFTAYNGTPTIDNVVGDPNTDWGFYIADVDYINVSDITFTRCWYAIYIRRSNNTHIINCTAYTYALVSATGKGFYINDDSHYCSIENCTVIGDAHNSYAVSGRYYDSGVWHCGECTYNTIKNCAAYNNTAHGFYDLAGNQSHTVVDNNVGYNNTGTCLYVHVGVLHDITITNNTFYDASTGITGTSVASPTSRIHNSTIKDNLIYDCAEGIKFYESDSMVVDNNTIHNMSAGTGVMLWGYNNTFTDNHVYDILSGSYYHYRTGPGLNGGSGNIIRNEINKTPRIYSAASTETVVEYTDGTVFTNNGAGSPRWYQDRSNYAVENAIITTITSHNITLRPTYGHLSDVTVDTWDEATDTYRITASSMQRDNPTWVNLTTKAAYTTYDITRDGEPCTPATTGADGVLRYYTDEWDGPQTFEFSYASDGAVPAPLVTNLRNDTPTQQTVTLRWDCSTPDMDYYTIYQNGALLNTTGNKYYSATDLSPDTTYIFSVSATKDGITDDSVSIIVRTAAEDNLPTARAGSDQTVNVNSSVTLDGSASTGDGITSHVWDFDSRNGIQQDATGAIVSHIYTGPGTYIATLTVTDTSGQTDSDNVSITVIEGTTQTTDVSRITNPIVPDGSLSEWVGADTVTFAGSDNTATVSLTWDGDNLYLGFDVTDTNLRASGTDEADSLHLDDSIEIYLDTNHNGGAAMQVDDYHFIVNLNGALVDDQGTGSGKNYSWTSHINYAIDLDGTLNDDSDTDNGYVVEVAIPWSDLGGAPVTGEVMGLNLAVNNNDGTEVQSLDWCNIDSSWAVPDGWGDMTFVGNLDSNTVHIADDVTASHGHSATVPIMIRNATGVACAGVKLTYDVSVVTVTGATEGDFTTFFGFDDEHAADGWVTINTHISGTQLTGDVKVADVTFVAVGEVSDTSTLDMEIISMADQNGYSVPGTVSNGLFTVVSDTSPPIVTDPSASQLIPDDTDGVPSWGETATLSVTVTDESDIASVTIDLSAIGGSPVQPMTQIGGNVWSVTTSASAGTPPQTYELQVCATDIHGYTNMSESVELVVMRNGDVTGDGDVSPDDVTLLENYVTYSGQHTVSSEFVADVTGDGVVNIADAMLLANYVASPDQYTLR